MYTARINEVLILRSRLKIHFPIEVINLKGKISNVISLLDPIDFGGEGLTKGTLKMVFGCF